MSELFGVAVVGCGTVGGGTAKILADDCQYLQKRSGQNIKLKYVVDIKFDHGKAIGLDESLFETDFNKVLEDEEVKVIVELVGGLTIAKTFMEKALKAGKHVVTANKALLAHYGVELFALARKHKTTIGFEASCGGGIPIIKALTDGLMANRNEAMYGIVNGTCNFILSEMIEKGQSYKDALSDAQKSGLAEADPTLDVTGMDSAHKLAIMSSLAFSKQVDLDQIEASGIDQLDLYDVNAGKELNYLIKLIASARMTDNGIDLSVAPAFIPKDHPLAWVSGPFNAVSVYGSSVGHTMYYGRGAGASPTASAVVADIIAISLGITQAAFESLDCWPDLSEKATLLPPEKSINRYYLRINTVEKPGVLAQYSACLAEEGISISAVRQQEKVESNESVAVVVITHEAEYGKLKTALDKIENLSTVQQRPVCIRIIEEHPESI